MNQFSQSCMRPEVTSQQDYRIKVKTKCLHFFGALLDTTGKQGR